MLPGLKPSRTLGGAGIKRNQAFAELGDTALGDLVPAGAEPQFVEDVDGRRDLGDSIRISGNIHVPAS